MEKKSNGDNGKVVIKDTDDYQTGWNAGYIAGELDGMDWQAEIARLAISTWEDIIPSEANDSEIIQDFWTTLQEIIKNGKIEESSLTDWDKSEESSVMDSTEEEPAESTKESAESIE